MFVLPSVFTGASTSAGVKGLGFGKAGDPDRTLTGIGAPRLVLAFTVSCVASGQRLWLFPLCRDDVHLVRAREGGAGRGVGHAQSSSRRPRGARSRSVASLVPAFPSLSWVDKVENETTQNALLQECSVWLGNCKWQKPWMPSEMALKSFFQIIKIIHEKIPKWQTSVE